MKENNDLVNEKEKKLKWLKFTDLSLRVLLTFVGTISIVGLLMFLNSVLGIGYVSCFISSIFLTQIYSMLCNFSLEGLDNKIKTVKNELKYNINKDENNEKYTNIEKIEFRFENLSTINKIKILNYIKENAELNAIDSNVSIEEDCISLICDSNYEYNSSKSHVRKRVK